MTYSIDLRSKALNIKEKKHLSYRETAALFDVGINSVSRWNKNLRPATTRNQPATKINNDALWEDVTNYPDAYLRERAERLKVSTSGIYDDLKRLGISCKKKRFHIRRQMKINVKISKSG